MSKPLDSLLKDIKMSRLCRDNVEKGKQLPHEPRPVFQISATARICIAGQAPGTRARIWNPVHRSFGRSIEGVDGRE